MSAIAKSAAGVALVLVTLGAVLAVRARTQAVNELDAASTEHAAALDAERDRSDALDAELAGERRRAHQAETRVKELAVELEAVRLALAEATAPPPEPEPAVAQGPIDWRTVVESYPAFRPENVGTALDDVDWEVVADSMSNMPALIAKLAEHMEQGRPMTELSADTVGSIQRYNAPLVTTAMKLAQQGVAGSDINGAFSHPGFMSNAIAATLLALDMPLDEATTTKLDALTADYTAREAKRVAGYGDDSYTVERLVDESRLKHEYFQKVYALLTDAQHAALRPEPVRGRTQLDIFCESLVWSGKAGPLVFTDRDDLTVKVRGWVFSRARVPETQHAPAGALIDTWINALPDELLARETDGLVNSGMLHVDQVTESAAQVLELLRTFDQELDLDDAQRAQLRAVPGSIVLYRRPVDEG